ncbi:MAG: GNAT family N-acetyltransferase [Salibacteraceae bacterium]
MEFEITIKQPSEIQYLQVLVLARYMALDLSNCQRHQFVVALSGGKIIGFLRTRQKKDITELATMGVVKAFRKQGVGKQLLKHVMQRNKQLHLVTCTPNYFEALGFSSVHKIPQPLIAKCNNTDLWAGYGDPVVLVYNSNKEKNNG